MCPQTNIPQNLILLCQKIYLVALKISHVPRAGKIFNLIARQTRFRGRSWKQSKYISTVQYQHRVPNTQQPISETSTQTKN